MNINFEHRFWLQILGDHMRFIRDKLSPEETTFLSETLALQDQADTLLDLARNRQDVTQEAKILVEDIKNFKKCILAQHIAGNIKIGLPPTFINHMLNELEEYERILYSPELSHVTDIHKLWLADAHGHVDALISELDATEEPSRKTLKKLKKQYNYLYLAALEFAGYLRTGIESWPALSKLNRDASLQTKLFIKFLAELYPERKDKITLGILEPLMADHMLREELYYLGKLAEASGVKSLAESGDPTRPRRE